ncbi:MAG: class I SAM-dependent methyltransferase [Acidobacteriia bacterium]|nr:class I SAM-dependent methyltransferase [Terriglobia bacterium]
MSFTDWEALATQYSRINDARRDTVFVEIARWLGERKPGALLDYGGGDGSFVCGLTQVPIPEIVVFDPTPTMVALAQEKCAHLAHVSVVGSVELIAPRHFDVATFNAVWMSLRSDTECVETLSLIHGFLRPGGTVVASVTHPCFRAQRFSTYRTDFDNARYFEDGSQFLVEMSDGLESVVLIDTHWSLGAMVRQLRKSGFQIEELREIRDRVIDGWVAPASPWLVLYARAQ